MGEVDCRDGDVESGASTPDKVVPGSQGGGAAGDAAVDAGAGCAGLQDPLEQQQHRHHHHYWQHAIFEDREIPDSLRRGFQFHGIMQRGSGRKLPLVLSAVRGVDELRRTFHWLARRHRKAVGQPHECPAPPPPVRWLAGLDPRPNVRKLSWWVALAFTLGSVLFVISGAAGVVTAVGNPAEKPPGLASLTAALIGWPNLIAANLCFFPGGIMQLIETTHMDYGRQLRAWRKGGRMGPRPPRRLFQPIQSDLRTVSFWAVVIQITGMLGFNMATIFTVVSTAVALPTTIERWTIYFGFTYGGAAFTASALLFCHEATGSWWRGLLPSRLSDLRSISWQSAFWNLQGSIGFLIGGAGEYASNFSWTQLQWIYGYGNLAGAVWFLLSSLLLFVEQANPNHP